MASTFSSNILSEIRFEVSSEIPPAINSRVSSGAPPGFLQNVLLRFLPKLHVEIPTGVPSAIFADSSGIQPEVYSGVLSEALMFFFVFRMEFFYEIPTQFPSGIPSTTFKEISPAVLWVTASGVTSRFPPIVVTISVNSLSKLRSE